VGVADDEVGLAIAGDIADAGGGAEALGRFAAAVDENVLVAGVDLDVSGAVDAIPEGVNGLGF